MKDKIRILFLASEAAPFIKVGGLGDVAGSLPPAISKLGGSSSEGANLEIRVVIPFHAGIDKSKYDIFKVLTFDIKTKQENIQVDVYELELHGITYYFISSPEVTFGDPIYSSDTSYDGFKYAFFSSAAAKLAKEINYPVDILHVNDWHAAPAVICLEELKASDEFYRNTESLLTVHNLPYLGLGAEDALDQFSLIPATDYGLPEWAARAPLPLGLAAATHINTVSNGYAEEILTEEFGSGLHDYLTSISTRISGIINGLDMDAWDPGTDDTIVQNYTKVSLVQRKKNKAALLQELGLPVTRSTPLLSMINRMDYQKGVDLVPPALRMVSDQDWQAVILGTGDPSIEDEAKRLESEFPGRIRTLIKFDAALARRIYAGSDAILIPSRYEPCGLTQMIGMRYGCVPIARATGGLKDTIANHSDESPGTGFLFEPADSAALAEAISSSLSVFRDQRRWRGIQLRGMSLDFSWQRSALEYSRLYNDLLSGQD